MATNRQRKGLPIGAISQDTNEPICGAWCHKTETYCQAPPMPNGRCKIHGGFNSDRVPRERKNTIAAGLYSKHLNTEEANIYGQLKIGTLEQEIKLLKVQLLRALMAQDKWEGRREALSRAIEDENGNIRTPEEIHDLMELTDYEYEKSDGLDKNGQPIEAKKNKVIRRKRDYKKEIRSWVKLIGRLETEHHMMMKEDIPDSERIQQIARDLKNFTQACDSTIPEGDVNDIKAGETDTEVEEAPPSSDTT